MMKISINRMNKCVCISYKYNFRLALSYPSGISLCTDEMFMLVSTA